jgi:hypothetical protein
VSQNNVTKVVWYILVQLILLYNIMSIVPGVRVQVSGFKKRRIGHGAIRLESWKA